MARKRDNSSRFLFLVKASISCCKFENLHRKIYQMVIRTSTTHDLILAKSLFIFSSKLHTFVSIDQVYFIIVFVKACLFMMIMQFVWARKYSNLHLFKMCYCVVQRKTRKFVEIHDISHTSYPFLLKLKS